MNYSVKRFSSKEHKESSDDDILGKKAVASAIVGAGMLSKSDDLLRRSNHYFDYKTDDRFNKVNDERVLSALKRKAESQGITIHSDPNIRGSFYDPSSDSIVLRSKGSAAEFAHELGHAQYNKSRSKNLIGKISHRGYGLSNGMLELIINPQSKKELNKTKLIGNGILITNGFRRGKNSVKEDESGKTKIDNKKILKSALLGTSISAPVLIAEASASSKGLRMMRKAGASKETLKASRKALGNAWGTYASVATKPILSELGGHSLGMAYGLHQKRKMKEKE